jgi:SSS family transporter
LNALDWIVIALYAGTVVSLGIWAGRKEKDTEDFFLAGRSMGWIPVAASALATSLSALTFIGVPGAAYGGAFLYLQLGIGNFLGWFLLARWFLPRFYELKVTTVYELLGHRFGITTQTAASIFFIFSRVLASGVRLAGCAIAVSVFFDLGLNTAIVLIASFALLYTITGGIKAVIWTDMLQLVLFILGATASLVFIWNALPGGFSEFVASGSAAGKFQVFNFSFDISDGKTFWAGNVFALFIGLAVGACDQDIAQRMLTCRDSKEARTAAWAAGIAPMFTSLLFLTVGAALFVYFQAFPDAGITELVTGDKPRYDYVFPYFIAHTLPAGLRGLLVAGLLAAAMSSLDSALNGLASSAYTDVYKLHWAKGREVGEAEALRFSRFFVATFAVILAATAMIFGRQVSILWFGLQAMGWTYGGLLGLFLLAVFSTKKTSEFGNVFALVTSVAVVLFFTKYLTVGWSWGIVIGTAWSYGVAFVWPNGEAKA